MSVTIAPATIAPATIAPAPHCDVCCVLCAMLVGTGAAASDLDTVDACDRMWDREMPAVSLVKRPRVSLVKRPRVSLVKRPRVSLVKAYVTGSTWTAR